MRQLALPADAEHDKGVDATMEDAVNICNADFLRSLRTYSLLHEGTNYDDVFIKCVECVKILFW